MNIDQKIKADVEKILELQYLLVRTNQQLSGQIEFYRYMCLHLYQDRLLQCSNSLGEVRRIENETLQRIRFIELSEGDNPDACLQIQGAAIEAGEAFFKELSEIIRESLNT